MINFWLTCYSSNIFHHKYNQIYCISWYPGAGSTRGYSPLSNREHMFFTNREWPSMMSREWVPALPRYYWVMGTQSRHFCIQECCIFNSRGQSSEYWIWVIHIQRPEYDHCPIFKISELNSLSIFKVIFNLSNFLQVPGLNYKPGGIFFFFKFPIFAMFQTISSNLKKNQIFSLQLLQVDIGCWISPWMSKG